MRYVTEYTVEGKLQFPVDMLRYDSSWPADSESAVSITRRPWEEPLEEGQWPPAQKVTLRRHGATKAEAMRVTEARWASFGWRVVPGSMRTWAI